jgi:hypothetical protein
MFRVAAASSFDQRLAAANQPVVSGQAAGRARPIEASDLTIVQM